MGMTERGILRRLHSLDFSESSRASLISASDMIGENLDRIIGKFYDVQLSQSEIAVIIGDADTLARLKTVMRGYITDLFSGRYDEEYVNNRLRIGRVHKRIGVSPKAYMNSMNLLQDILRDEIVQAFGDVMAADIREALRKILLFDTYLVSESYVDAYLLDMAVARSEVEKYAGERGIATEMLSGHLHDVATRDSLTGLANREALQDVLHHEINTAQRYKLPLSLAFMDLNGFKAVNDSYGHDEGDAVLRDVSSALSSVTRVVDVAARYGGDEFCLVLPRADLTGARLVMTRLEQAFRKMVGHDISFSSGLVQVNPESAMETDALIAMADELMYEAKRRSKSEGGFQIAEALT